MRRDILQALPLIAFEGENGPKGVSLRAYCRALSLGEDTLLTLSSRDGYAVALTAAQTEEAYLVLTEGRGYLLALPSSPYRRQWVKDVVDITAGEGKKNP